MVPHQAVDAVLKELTLHLAKGDTIIDGGNSPYKESIRRGRELEGKGIDFLDAGVSGGPQSARGRAPASWWAASRKSSSKYEQIFRDASVEQGYAYFGKTGAGHFVKMVHNGIEYGMMQALAEGFAILKASEFDLDLGEGRRPVQPQERDRIAAGRLAENRVEQHGTELDGISGAVAQSGEGMWTVEAAKEFGIPAPIIKGALDFRLQSEKHPSYTGKIVSALRNQFGGHAVEITSDPLNVSMEEGKASRERVA